MTRPRICVLVPVHAGTSATQLDSCLHSIAAQTTPADEVLLIEDGPLTSDHDVVIDRARSELPQLEVLELPHAGIAVALQAGLHHTQLEWVARMDADDVAEPHRLERQAEVAATGQFDVIGSAMVEFNDDPSVVTAVRNVPVAHADILRRMRHVNPINHPTATLRRELALSVGGYLPLAGLEDYDLWARLAAGGAKFANLSDALVRYRVGNELYARRRGRALLRAEVQLQRNLRRYGLIGRVAATSNLVVRIGFRLLPPVLMRVAYRVLRTPVRSRPTG